VISYSEFIVVVRYQYQLSVVSDTIVLVTLYLQYSISDVRY